MRREEWGFIAALVLFLVLASLYVAVIVFAIIHGALYIQR